MVRRSVPGTAHQAAHVQNQGHAAIARGVHPIPVATGEHCQNRVIFKQFLQADALQEIFAARQRRLHLVFAEIVRVEALQPLLQPLIVWLWVGGLCPIVLARFAPDLHAWLALSAVWDTKALNWIGFIGRKPITEDFAPLLPWVGVMWWGLAAGQWVLENRREWAAGTLPRALQPAATLGRWSLSFYMLHQPVLIGLLLLVMQLRG